MAILSQRLHRLGELGYDVLHLETNSSIVVRPNGRNVEDSLLQLEILLGNLNERVQITNQIPAKLSPGYIAIVGNSVYIGDGNSVPVEINTTAIANTSEVTGEDGSSTDGLFVEDITQL